eukprot:gene9298-1386_t
MTKSKKAKKTGEKEDYLKPDLHTFLNVKKQILELEFKLPSVPLSKINIEATENHIHLDTLQHKKKYFYESTYPDNVSCEFSKQTAEFDGVTLKLQLPLLKVPAEKSKPAEKPEPVENKSKNAEKKAEVKKNVNNPKKTEEKKDYLKPDLHTFLHLEKQFLKLEFKLPSVPLSKINIEAKKNHIHLDTLQHTRKYFYESTYPGNVSCEISNELNAEFDGTTLKLQLPLLKVPAETEKAEKAKLESIRETKKVKLKPQQRKIIQQHKVAKIKKQAKTQRKRENIEYHTERIKK